jgi:hypothetical protein
MALGASFGQAYATKAHQAMGARDATLANNAYSRFLAQQRGSRSLVDINRTMTQGLEHLATGFTSRGMGYSGAFQQGQTDYATNWMQQNQDANDGIAQAYRQADLSDSQANSGYDSTLADLQADKNARIQDDAANLAQFQPFL